MAFLLSALVLLALIAGSVTITDAVRAPHWRQVAVERRRSWHERTGHTGPDADDGSAHDGWDDDWEDDGDDDPGDDGSGDDRSGDAHVRGTRSFSSARG